MSKDLAFMSASEALARFKDRSLSPVELTQAVIERAYITEPSVNALCYTYFDQALETARSAEKRYMGSSDPPGPLEGICVAVKDSGHIEGQPTSAGSLLTEDTPQPQTSPINQRVLETGAIVHARSTTPEYSSAVVTWSRRWGVTRNPWNLNVTPGGSSGGAAATLAAGSSTLATGSDIGGSIRVPASCCGIVGYKPPRGRNPVDAPFNLDPYCHTGPLARSVKDTLLFQNLLSGQHRQDSTTLPSNQISAGRPSLKGMRIAISHDLGFYEVDNEVTAALSSCAEKMMELGASVEEVSLPWDEALLHAGLTHLRMIFGTSIAPSRKSDWKLMAPYARAFAEAGLNITPRQYLEALTVEGRAGEDFGRTMTGYDALICPTTAIPGVAVDFDPGNDELQVNGTDIDPMLGWVMTVPFNILSTCPVLAVPAGIGSQGVPIGMQIVGRPFDETAVFDIGLAFEASIGQFAVPPFDD